MNSLLVVQQKLFIIIGTIVAIVLAGIIFLQNRETPPEENGGTGGGSAASSEQTETPPPPVARETACADGGDNDADRLADCDDPDCAADANCRCEALSCGNPGNRTSEVTCRREEGCICDARKACIPCKQKDQLCETSADCCQGFGLDCQEFLVDGNRREKRCAPSGEQVCVIRCEGDPKVAAEGTWGRPYSCGLDNPPPNAALCDELSGSCTLSSNNERNTVKCVKR